LAALEAAAPPQPTALREARLSAYQQDLLLITEIGAVFGSRQPHEGAWDEQMQLINEIVTKRRHKREAATAGTGGAGPPMTVHGLPQAKWPVGQDYLNNLRHDLQDEEYARRYLSACAMESGDALRIGIRDVFAAIAV